MSKRMPFCRIEVGETFKTHNGALFLFKKISKSKAECVQVYNNMSNRFIGGIHAYSPFDLIIPFVEEG